MKLMCVLYLCAAVAAVINADADVNATVTPPPFDMTTSDTDRSSHTAQPELTTINPTFQPITAVTPDSNVTSQDTFSPIYSEASQTTIKPTAVKTETKTTPKTTASTAPTVTPTPAATATPKAGKTSGDHKKFDYVMFFSGVAAGAGVVLIVVLTIYCFNLRTKSTDFEHINYDNAV